MSNRREEIAAIFEQAQKEDGWDMSADMIYSFEFVDADTEKLERLGEELDSKGFIFVDIFQLGDEQTDEPTGEFLLQVDFIGSHDPESLARQIDSINEDAAKFGVAELDGWEVGELDEFEEDESGGIED